PGSALDPVLTALSAGELVRSVQALRPGQLAPSAVSLGFALTALELAKLDVTDTTAGRQEADAFVARLRQEGVAASASGFKVYALPSVQQAVDAARQSQGAADEADTGPLESALVVPSTTTVELVGAVFKAGQLHVKTSVSAAGVSVEPAQDRHYSTMGSPSDSAHWERAGGVGCLKIKENSTAHYYPCQWFWNMANDGDPNHGYWASEMYGTGKSHSVWSLTGLEVESRRKAGTAAQEWVDWDPGADGKQNCASQSVSVSYAGVGVSVDKQHCELWDIDKGREALDMSNWWKGQVWRSERETAAMTLTRTKAGEAAHGVFDFDYYARP
ncbi:MAG: hypothetical protein ACRDZ3_23015, partial [Acidimicrobiia bacterium]